MGNNLSGLRLVACNDYARYVLNSMHCRSKCYDCCEWSANTGMGSVTESESEDAVTPGETEPYSSYGTHSYETCLFCKFGRRQN